MAGRTPRIVIVGSSPMMARGVAAALLDRAGGNWEVALGSPRDSADAWVLLGEQMVVRGAQGGVAQLAADCSAERLAAALGAVLQGLAVREQPWLAETADHEPLTPRELEVFELLGKGLSNREIGELLGISAHTAKYHVAQILAKVGAATRAEAVSEGLRQGLIGV